MSLSPRLVFFCCSFRTSRRLLPQGKAGKSDSDWRMHICDIYDFTTLSDATTLPTHWQIQYYLRYLILPMVDDCYFPFTADRRAVWQIARSCLLAKSRSASLNCRPASAPYHRLVSIGTGAAFHPINLEAFCILSPVHVAAKR